jgi:tetratricopeptide (TPR) repeat protein/transglutaminase-like putative cysteine protease
MWKYLWFSLLAACFAACSLDLNAQGSPAQVDKGEKKPGESTPSKSDYSKEAYVDEQDITKVTFENDGTGTRETSARIRIQSDAGVQRFGILTLPYQGTTESVDIDYVRVLKPDGTTISTPTDNVQDMPTEITRQAPFYSDLREKHVAVKGLGTGDVLEMRVHWHVTKPLAPGQFWYSFNFSRDAIVLKQEFQVDVPKDRAIKWKGRGEKPVITDEGTRRVYAWTHSELEQKSPEEQTQLEDEQIYRVGVGKLLPSDVQISSFQSWEEIGSWYNRLQSDRVKPSAEVRAKALELTRDAKDDDAKLRALYKYVSTQFRYIGVAFGIGRYQPHAAEEVLDNQYGDCKDKHTLLASLLDAVGIKAYPALISSRHVVDAEVPSPAQFDHMITAVPRGNGYIWLDTTAEVAPYEYLVSPLWDKPALIIPPTQAAMLVTTPAEPPLKASETFEIDAKLKEDGTLEGKIQRTVSRSDIEILMRSAFRSAPMTQWNTLVQRVSYASGFAGDVSEVRVSAPENTEEAFRVSYTYTRKDYPQWSEHRISSPLPPMLANIPEKRPNHPVLLGMLGEIRYESRVAVPQGYKAQLPAALDLIEKFAEYHARYSSQGGILQTERRLLVKLREVPESDYESFKKFSKAVSDDHETYVGLQQGHITPASFPAAIWTLPDSKNSQAVEAYNDATEQYDQRNIEGEIESLKRAVQLDPKFTRAWLWLSELYMYQRNQGAMFDAMHSAIANDPQQPLSYKLLGLTLLLTGKYDEAIPVWKQLIAIAPDDSDGPEDLGATLFALKRYPEAAEAFESAIKLNSDRAFLYRQLGTAYVREGNEGKALTAYKKTLQLDTSPEMFNDIGYELADANKQLPLALQYAERAVHEEEEVSAKLKMSDLKDQDLGYSSTLAAYWDTLGWVYFRMGTYDKAESYLQAAWVLSEAEVIGDHLGQVYEIEHKKEQAIRMYQLALTASQNPGSMKETKARLEHIGGATNSESFHAHANDELNKMRTVKLERVTPEAATAEFLIIFGPGSKVEEVKFVSGSEKLKGSEKVLNTTAFHLPFPDDGPTKLLRRGILSCYAISGCSFVLYLPNSVRSVH